MELEKSARKRNFTNARRRLLHAIDLDYPDREHILAALDLVSETADGILELLFKMYEVEPSKELSAEIHKVDDEYSSAVSRTGDVLQALAFNRPSQAQSRSDSPATIERAKVIQTIRAKLDTQVESDSMAPPPVSASESTVAHGVGFSVQSNPSVSKENENIPPPLTKISAVAMATGSQAEPKFPKTELAVQSSHSTLRTSATAFAPPQQLTVGSTTIAAASSSAALPHTGPSSVAQAFATTLPPACVSTVSRGMYNTPTAPVQAPHQPQPMYAPYIQPLVPKPGMQPPFYQPPLQQQFPVEGHLYSGLSQPQYVPQLTPPQLTPPQLNSAVPVVCAQPPRSALPSTQLPQGASAASAATNWSSGGVGTNAAANFYALKHVQSLKIPTFRGDKRAFASWRAAFMASIGDTCATTEMKMLHLRQYLSEEPLKTIENLGFSASAYQVAIDRLDKKYGGDRRQLTIRLEEVEKFPPLGKGNRATELEKFADLIEVLVVLMTDSGRSQELADGTLHLKLQSKLPSAMLTDYSRWRSEQKQKPSVESLLAFVNREAEFAMEANEITQGISSVSLKSKPTDSARRTHYGSKQPAKQQACVCCEQHHAIWQCAAYRKLAIDDRWRIAKRGNLCYRCLGGGHMGKDCPRDQLCGIQSCKDTHHPLLHATTDAKGDSSDASNGSGAQKATHTVSHHAMKTSSALRTVPVILTNGAHEVHVNALLDDGSTQTLISSSIAKELHLYGRQQPITVNTLNGHKETFSSMQVAVQLTSSDGTTVVDMIADTVPAVSSSLQPVSWQREQRNWKHLSGIPFEECERKTVDLLIGVDYSDLHVSLEEVVGQLGEPVARRTPLGWTCVGQISSDNTCQLAAHHCLMTEADQDLNRIVRQFWEVDEPPHQRTSLTPHEQQAWQIVEQSLQYVDGRYQVGIPWRGDRPTSLSSYATAFKRLQNTEKRLQRDPAVQQAYADTIHDHVSKGYVQKVANVDPTDDQAWYLPHFPIIKPDKATTKVRIVFDAAAKSDGKSLNDYILPGPKLQADLVQVLIRFRREPVALVCDIAQMYLRIQLDPKDRPYHRFLWRTDPSASPEVYEFSSVVFGVNASPFLAQYVSQQNARAASADLSLAASVVLDSTYMDDSMTSAADAAEGKEVYCELTALWQQANMHPRKWLSNSSEVLQIIPQEDRANQLELNDTQLPAVKTLGVLWMADSDVFTFQFSVPGITKLTKRQFLRILAGIFDPLGLLAPYVVRAKCLFQQMWIEGYDWDVSLPHALKEEADTWFHELSDLAEVQVPRCLQSADKTVANKQLQVFVDASEKAFGAVVYQQSEYGDGTSAMQIVASKLKVAPLAAHSIPRLELMAAVLGVQLAQSVLPPLNLTMSDVTFWTDSADVLYWIRGQSRKYKPFVAHRVGTIQTASNPDQWNHVGTSQNPADLLTRGMSARQLADSQFWWCGPDMTRLEWQPSAAPAAPASAADEMKRRAVETMHISHRIVSEQPELNPERYDSMLKLARVLAWINRFVTNARLLNASRVSGPLSVEEIRDAEFCIIRRAQHDAFTEEISSLQRGKPISPKSALSSLQPQLDDDGVLRCGGRLRYAENVSPDARCPIILPRSSRVTTLIIRRAHVGLYHVGGTNQTLAELSQRFWIISAREAIREYEQQCQLCRRQKAKTLQQVMAPLPSHRTKPSMRAFATTAVDFCGPFYTKQGRGRSQCKRYLAVFTCTATRAVHLEMVNDLTTDGFLNSLCRFISRRGTPTDIISDNGTNFVGAVRELQQLVGEVEHQRVANKLSAVGVTWHFNPPAAPHFGGVHESMVKSAKRAVYAILQHADITDEELATCFTAAESMLNSRPLTYQSAHPCDDVPLTPNHFLIGQVGGQFAPACAETDFNPRRRWRMVQHLVEMVWQRWQKEWLPLLHPARKWRKVLPDVKVGDVVVVAAIDTPRGQWPLARVAESYPGKDGHVRVVKVRLGNGKYMVRPIAKLCPLC